jgi:hypothetical protein
MRSVTAIILLSTDIPTLVLEDLQEIEAFHFIFCTSFKGLSINLASGLYHSIDLLRGIDLNPRRLIKSQ